MAEYGTNRTEKHLLGLIGASPHKNSGRQTKKGDGTFYNFTVDVKESKSFTLNSNVWAKVVSDAISNHNDPMLLVVLEANKTIRTKLAIIEFDTLLELLEKND